ncbi:hypothetical protein [uncultured Dokdonia sp.]|nr:hypothetical protein [uncultured Dokdonia sp.]
MRILTKQEESSINGGSSSTMTITQVGNDEITWEEEESFNIPS